MPGCCLWRVYTVNGLFRLGRWQGTHRRQVVRTSRSIVRMCATSFCDMPKLAEATVGDVSTLLCVCTGSWRADPSTQLRGVAGKKLVRAHRSPSVLRLDISHKPSIVPGQMVA